MFTGTLAGLRYTVARVRFFNDPEKPEEGSYLLWHWEVFRNDLLMHKGEEPSFAAACNAAQEQCSMAPQSRAKAVQALYE